MTRNWVSHANLLEPLTPQFIAFMFLINMRAMFKLPKDIQPYERILLTCISSSSVNRIEDALENILSNAKNDIDGILEGLGKSKYKRNKDDKNVPPQRYLWVNNAGGLSYQIELFR